MFFRHAKTAQQPLRRFESFPYWIVDSQILATPEALAASATAFATAGPTRLSNALGMI